MKYEDFFAEKLNGLREAGNYRVFADIERQVGQFPRVRNHTDDGTVREVSVWCSNDYLGMGSNPDVINAMNEANLACGAGAGGTRNISGTTHYHVLLEQELADWHQAEAALLMTSGYVANMTALATLGANIPGCVIFSDEKNHNSMIEGIRHSRAAKHVWKHNDPEDLNKLLGQYDLETPKLVAFESVYSMDGDIAPLKEILDVCEAHNAMSYLDEVHAVGMYGPRGAGVAERDGVAHRITVMQATLAKAVGVVGGYIAGTANMVDFVRSFGQGFIFTSSLPPGVAAGAARSIQILKTAQDLRTRHQERAKTLTQKLLAAGIPAMETPSHIVPVIVGDATLCKKATDMLMSDFNVYVQPINYPTVAKGTERLRFTATPLHSDEEIDHLVYALTQVWNRLGLQMAAQ